MLKHLLIFALGLALTACLSTGRPGGSGLVNDSRANTVTSKDIQNPIDLSDYLRRVAGVKILGEGAGAQVAIRGPITFNSGQGPLYVLNGSILGYDYSTLYNAVNINEISSVRVLKNASEAGIYGVRGATGVVEITLKSGNEE